VNYSVIGIVQARMSSRRFPGKVLAPIQSRAMLSLQLERLSYCKNIDHILVATSDDGSDDKIEILCKEEGNDFFRGSLNNVLDRFFKAAQKYKPKTIVRFTADCPLIDPLLTDEIVEYFLKSDLDYISNFEPPTYPDGLDVEVFRFESLKLSATEAKLPSELEHVTPFIKRRPKRFRIKNYVSDIDYSHLRWTVDDPVDLEFVREIYKHLYSENKKFGMEDILELLEKFPELIKINKHLKRNEGSKNSRNVDIESLKEQ